ncbi:xaa-Pro aminopeptidase ApepP isoform X2 [Aphidius gifuensis]|uniref:xaa-Pro aminopeptidase ApepP isoform X2 n=1 Tax=Aphidius gifuensis TaxID=684658 RepID=UPI001CDC3718|nr:xaa-Pro aminopeptidase ApepP isoform X2 [Aphidius gifuensis]
MEKNKVTKLSKLRELMAKVEFEGMQRKGVQAFIVKSEDAHLSEYIMDRDKRREYISGFRGSYGTAIITENKAALWTDGRYYAQASSELYPPEDWILMKDGTIGTPSQDEWLKSVLPLKSTIAVDPTLISYSNWAQLQLSLTEAGHFLYPIKQNLIDELWGDEQPPSTLNPVLPQPFIYTGKKAGEKIAKCRKEMIKSQTDILVITALDEIAYLLNLRGSDIPYNPVFFAYVIITITEVHFFIDESRLTAEAKQQLCNEHVNVTYHPYSHVTTVLKELSFSVIRGQTDTADKIWIHNDANYALHQACGDVRRHFQVTPVRLMVIVKNDVEIENMKKAHLRDSVALVKYFSWLEDKIVTKSVPSITEVTGADQLEKFRREQENFVGLSFETISAVGAHGAQYYDGTTDVTRTFHFGIPTDFERECFTRVFKGQTALASATFPIMIKGNYLDTLARKSLWDVGLHYLHGTGHGVGAYLNVHESPTGISWRPYPDDPGVQPGMFLSNEPGFYEDGKFGIRLENVMCTTEATTRYSHRDLQFLKFETVTFVPIQTKLLDVSLLTNEEIDFLNHYHRQCWDLLKTRLQGTENIQALEWLRKETKPISKE